MSRDICKENYIDKYPNSTAVIHTKDWVIKNRLLKEIKDELERHRFEYTFAEKLFRKIQITETEFDNRG